VPARVYRVRRALVLLAAVLLAASPVAASRLERPGPAAPAEAPAARVAQAAPAATRVVVRRGDTIWELARARRPAETDLAAYVREVIAVNEVDPTALAPGSVLWFPGP
jgi:nucleoid-associated protein YgaU